MICLTQEVQSQDSKDTRMKISIRSLASFNKELANLECDKNPGACRINLLHLTQLNNPELNLDKNLLVCAINNEAKIWSITESDSGLELFEINTSPEQFYKHGVISRISGFLKT